jgi:hypothetical protein
MREVKVEGSQLEASLQKSGDPIQKLTKAEKVGARLK